ncbi:hypothetical protein K0M31_006745, partial [Melipona bicolor]
IRVPRPKKIKDFDLDDSEVSREEKARDLITNYRNWKRDFNGYGLLVSLKVFLLRFLSDKRI